MEPDSELGNYGYYGRIETVIPTEEEARVPQVAPYNYLPGPSTAPEPAGASAPPQPADNSASVRRRAFFNMNDDHPEPQQTTISILFVRHAESCANMLKKVGRSGFKGGYESNTYLDPELTARGHAMAVERGRELTRIIPMALGNDGPLYFGASVLRRTQQTARRLLEGMGPGIGPDTIFVLPYISELSNVFGQTFGYDRDNTPVPRDQRLPAVIPGQATLDFVSYDNLPDGRIPNVPKFFQWLGSWIVSIRGNFPRLTGESPPTHIRLVIVTHGHWMKALSKMLGSSIKYGNVESAVVTVTYGPAGELLMPGIQWKVGPDGRQPLVHLRFTPSPAVNQMACPDGCLGSATPICSGVSLPVCQRLEGLYRQYATAPVGFIQNLERDLRIMELYQPIARPQVMTALDNLRNHVAGKRSRGQLPGDLIPIMDAYGCGGRSAEEACELVVGALVRPNLERLDETTLMRIADAARAPALRNYTRKATGWFGVRRGSRYTKSRTGLRRDLEMIRDSVCPVVVPAANQGNAQNLAAASVSSERNSIIPVNSLSRATSVATGIPSYVEIPTGGSVLNTLTRTERVATAPRRRRTWRNWFRGRWGRGGSRITQKRKTSRKH